MTNQLALLEKRKLSQSFEVTPCGLVVEGHPSKEEYLETFGKLDLAHRAIHWWIGDLLLNYENQYGDIKALVTEVPFQYQTLRIDKYVANRYELFKRLNNLKWDHHFIAAPETNRFEWLEKAEKNNWSTRDLQRAIKESKPQKTPPWLKVYDLWMFPELDTRFGKEYQGRIPGQIIQNLLYYYTNKSDLVIDPMAGGGVTIDVCKELGRRCVAFDIEKHPSREDVVIHDSRKPWPIDEKADLIFIDPPYGYMLNYAGVGEGEFQEGMEKVLDHSIDNLKDGGHLAILIAPQVIKEGFQYIEWTFILWNYLKDFLKPIRRIMVPVSSQQVGPNIVKDAKDKKYLIALIRDLIIFQKEENIKP